MKLAPFAVVGAMLAAWPAQAWMLTAVVKAADGSPKVLGYSFGNDRQACLAAIEAIKKMQPEATIVQACVDEAIPRPASQSALATLPICPSSGASGAPALCLLRSETGDHLVSGPKHYSLNCGPYDCEGMAQEYRATGRVSDPRERPR